MPWISTAFVAGLALVHIFAGKLRSLDRLPRSRWLSLAGGVSVAYVFIHIFPELEKAQRTLHVAGGDPLAFLEYHAYLVALLGLTVFYGLERFVRSPQARRPDAPAGETPATLGAFALHIATFAVYNALIGYLMLHREERDFRGLAFFFVAMAFHFLVNDFGLRSDHKQTYHRVGRWILAAAVVTGWVVGLTTEVHQAVVAVLFAFLAGGVVLNVLKEELPAERQSRFWPFALGAALYAAFLLGV